MKDYLFKHNIPVKKFAADLGISASYLYQLLKKERKPSLELALKIERHTKGRVSVDALRIEEKKIKSSGSLNASEKVIESKLEAIENFVKNLDERIKMLERAFALTSI